MIFIQGFRTHSEQDGEQQEASEPEFHFRKTTRNACKGKTVEGQKEGQKPGRSFISTSVIDRAFETLDTVHGVKKRK